MYGLYMIVNTFLYVPNRCDDKEFKVLNFTVF